MVLEEEWELEAVRKKNKLENDLNTYQLQKKKHFSISNPSQWRKPETQMPVVQKYISCKNKHSSKGANNFATSLKQH